MTYADTFDLRDRSLVTLGDIADAIDGLLAEAHQTQAATTVSTTSATYTNLIEDSVAVADGESVLVVAEIMISHSTGNASQYLKLMRDSQALGMEHLNRAHTTAADGQDHSVSLSWIDTPSAGTYTYAVQWKTSAATFYSRRQSMACLKFQTS
jgi:hypothetical protein